MTNSNAFNLCEKLFTRRYILSIDSFLDNYQLIVYNADTRNIGGARMSDSASNHHQISLEDVENFLRSLHEVLQSKDFNITRDLDILLKKSSEASDDPYTTQNTLIDLEFDREDVKQQLLELRGVHYYETIIDNKDPTLPPFHAFIKEIEHRNVYIKVKIRDYARRKVFCVSFHYVRYPIQSMPYAT